MNDHDKANSHEFAQLLLGKLAKKNEIDILIASCSSFEEFRIAVVLKYQAAHQGAKDVADYWRARVEEKRVGSDVNALAHTVELLVVKQAEIEEKLKLNTAEMLEKLKAIDSLATAQAATRERLAEVNDLIDRYRQLVERAETVTVAKEAGK